MKRVNFFYTTLLLVMIPLIEVYGQDSCNHNFQIKTGFGYFDPQAAGPTGNIFYTDIGYRLPTEFLVHFGFGLSDVFDSYKDDEIPLFADFRKIRNYYFFRLYIERLFRLGANRKHQFNIGTGLLYEQLRYAEPFVYSDQVNQELIIGLDESNRKQDEAGLMIFGEYGYRLGHLLIGIHTETHFLYGYGTSLGGIVIAPQLSFTF